MRDFIGRELATGDLVVKLERTDQQQPHRFHLWRVREMVGERVVLEDVIFEAARPIKALPRELAIITSEYRGAILSHVRLLLSETWFTHGADPRTRYLHKTRKND